MDHFSGNPQLHYEGEPCGPGPHLKLETVLIRTDKQVMMEKANS